MLLTVFLYMIWNITFSPKAYFPTDDVDLPTYKTTLFHPVTIGVKVNHEDDVDEDHGIKAMSYDLYDDDQKF